MDISVLASGSSGNCTFVDSGESKILIDVGIGLKRIKKNLSELGTEIKELDGVFITHEHDDHIRGIEKLDRDIDAPIFMKSAAYGAYGKLLSNFTELERNTILNDLKIESIPISHDAAEPVGFHIQASKTLSFFTDLGKYDDIIKLKVKESDALIIESNHDVDMLLNGPYPYDLKQRILGEKGHLSNIDAGILVRDNHSEELRNVFLAHLSKTNNTGETALETFNRINHKTTFNKILTNQGIRTDLVKI